MIIIYYLLLLRYRESYHNQTKLNFAYNQGVITHLLVHQIVLKQYSQLPLLQRFSQPLLQLFSQPLVRQPLLFRQVGYCMFLRGHHKVLLQLSPRESLIDLQIQTKYLHNFCTLFTRNLQYPLLVGKHRTSQCFDCRISQRSKW